jgi:tetratricopeptide (TPR) repeat protein
VPTSTRLSRATILLVLAASTTIGATAAPQTAEPQAPVQSPPGRGATTAAAIQEFQETLKQRRALKLGPDTTGVWLALRQHERDALQDAITAARTDDELLAIVDLASANGHRERAITAAKTALKRAGAPLPWHYFAIADSALVLSLEEQEPRKTDLLREAKSAVQSGLKLQMSGRAWLLAGDIHDALREWAPANAAYELALKGLTAADQPAALRGLWRASSGLNLPADTEKWFAEFAKTGRATDADYYERANYLASLKRFSEAAAQLATLARKPGQQTPVPSHQLWYSVTFAHWLAGESDAALAAATNTAAAGAGNPEATRTIAMAQTIAANVQYGRGAYDRAVDAGRAAVAADPGFSGGHTQLARALVATGKMAEAESTARKAVALANSTDGDAWFILGSILGGKLDWTGASQAFSQAAAIDAADAYAAFYAAMSFDKIQRAADAITWYEEALRRNPQIKERDEIRAALAKLKKGV